jgi:hypothetical protein
MGGGESENEGGGRRMEHQLTLEPVENKVIDAMKDAENKAWEALSGYKFWMFGYHAARWVNYNRLLVESQPNPFKEAVKLAREHTDKEVQGRR